MAQQTQAPGLLESSHSAAVADQISCNPWRLQPPSGELNFEQRACFYGARLARPSSLFQGTIAASFGQWRNSPRIAHEDFGQFGRRFGIFYARRGTQAGGELIAGYLNHEDPRPRVSSEHGFWNRTRAALLSVVEVKDADGDARPALAPVAGAFGSGMVSIACYRSRNSVADGFRRSGFVYSTYFGRAIFQEFRPDLTAFANRFLRHKK